MYNASGGRAALAPDPEGMMHGGAGFRLHRGCNRKITGLPNEKNSIISVAATLPNPDAPPVSRGVFCRKSGRLYLRIREKRPKIRYAINGAARLISPPEIRAIVPSVIVLSNNRNIISLRPPPPVPHATVRLFPTFLGITRPPSNSHGIRFIIDRYAGNKSFGRDRGAALSEGTFIPSFSPPPETRQIPA